MKLNTGRSRILVHLWAQKKSIGYDEHKEVPFSLCQKGISESVDLSRNRTSEIIRDLVEKGLVEESVRRVVGLKRRRKVYSLTEKGMKRAKEIRDELKDREVKVKTDSSTYEVKLEEIDSYLDSREPFLVALNNLDEKDTLDLTEPEKKKEDVFVGREEEIASLSSGLEKAKNGEASVYMIRGKAGIGKTRLVNEFKNHALSNGFDFIAGKGYYYSSEPYLPFKEAFKKFQDEENVDYPLEFPEGSSKTNKIPSEKELQDKNYSDVIFSETIKNIKKIVKKRPLLIFIDDLQWVDKASLILFHYIADKLNDQKMMLIGSYRPEDVVENDFLREILQRMNREDLYDEISLEPLTWEDTREIIKSLIGKYVIPEDFAKIIHETSEGNPLFSKELVKQMLDDGTLDPKNKVFPSKKNGFELPKVIDEIIERRIKRLNKENLKVLQIGSIIGEDIPFALLHKVSDLESFELLEYTDILTGSGIWDYDAEDDLFHFAHGLIYLSIYQSIPKHIKKILHGEVAEAMEKIFEDDLKSHYHEIGKHYKVSSNYSKAMQYFEKAGENARNLYAYQDAIEIFEKAFDLAEKTNSHEKIGKISLKLGDLYSIIGKYEKSLDYYEMVPLDELETDQEARKFYRKKAKLFDRMGRLKEAIKLTDKGLEIGNEENMETAKLLNRKGWAQMRIGYHSSAKENFLKALKISKNQGEENEFGDMYHALGSIYIHDAEYDEALKYLKKGLEVRDKNDDKEGKASSLANIGNVYLKKGEIYKALDKFNQSLEILREIGKKDQLFKILTNIGNARLKKGELEKAYECYKESQEIIEELDDVRGLNISLTNLGNYHILKGDFDKALEYHKKSLEMSQEKDLKNGIALGHNNLGIIYTHKEDYDNAKSNFFKSIEICEETENYHLLVHPLVGLAHIFNHEKKFEKALEKAERALEISKNIGAKIEEGISNKALGIVHRDIGNFDEAKIRFEKGKEMLSESGESKEMGKLLFEEALLAKKIDDGKKHDELLKKAKSLFEERDMKYWIEKCEKEIES